MSKKNNDDSFFISKMKTYPVIRDQKEIARLVKLWQTEKDQQARNQLVYANCGLVLAQVRRYTNRGLDLPDLIQEGLIGLMRALETFDPQKAAFSTYATWWIYHGIIRALDNKARTIRVSVNMQSNITLISALVNSFYAQHGRQPSNQEIYAMVHVLDGTAGETWRGKRMTLRDVELCQNLIHFKKEMSIHTYLRVANEDTTITLGEGLIAPKVDVVEYLDAKRLRQAVLKLTQEMIRKNSRLLTVLRLRFKSEMNLVAIGKSFGVSRQYIGQMENDFVGTIAKKLKITKDDVREVLTWLPLIMQPDSKSPSRDFTKEETDELFKLLCEHLIKTPAGACIVKEPMRTLEVRKNLTPKEARNALEKMRAAGKVEGKTPWTILQVIPKVAIPKHDLHRYR